MSTVIFDMRISREQFLAWYRGARRIVSVRARDGRVIHFPANILQPYVTHDGIQGSFALHFDEQNKFRSIERLG